jgi:hypothetical protein
MGLALMCAQSSAPIVLTGTARDCFRRTTYKIPGVGVAAFDPARSRELLDLLHAMDTAVFADDDTAAMTRFEDKFERLKRGMAVLPALSRATSDSVGRFVLTVPSLDGALVIGYEDMEDELNYFSYTMVKARTSSSFFLDMSRGECRY